MKLINMTKEALNKDNKKLKGSIQALLEQNDALEKGNDALRKACVHLQEESDTKTGLIEKLSNKLLNCELAIDGLQARLEKKQKTDDKFKEKPVDEELESLTAKSFVEKRKDELEAPKSATNNLFDAVIDDPIHTESMFTKEPLAHSMKTLSDSIDALNKNLLTVINKNALNARVKPFTKPDLV